MAGAVFTAVPDAQDVYGRTRRTVYDVTLETTYSAGGLLIGPGAVGLRTIQGARVIGGNAAGKVLLHQVDTTTTPGSVKLISMYPTGGGAASPAALGDPAITAGAVAMTSNAANGAADVTPGQAKEVAANTNLSTITVRVEFFGN